MKIKMRSARDSEKLADKNKQKNLKRELRYIFNTIEQAATIGQKHIRIPDITYDARACLKAKGYTLIKREGVYLDIVWKDQQ